MAYCWPRQVRTPRAATTNKSWLARKNGTNRRKKSQDHAVTGMTPKHRKITGAAR